MCIYIYIYWTKERHKNMCPCNGSRINSNYERQLWMPVANCGPQSLTSNSATHCYVEQANHSVTTHLSKRIGTSHSLPRTRHNRELILGGKYSPQLRMICQWRTMDPDVSQAPPPPTAVTSVLTMRPRPIHQNGLALSALYYIPDTTVSPFCLVWKDFPLLHVLDASSKPWNLESNR